MCSGQPHKRREFNTMREDKVYIEHIPSLNCTFGRQSAEVHVSLNAPVTMRTANVNGIRSYAIFSNLHRQ